MEMSEFLGGPKSFAELWARLSKLYRVPFDEDIAELSFRALQDFSLEEVKEAVQVYVKTGKFMPRPAELREIITGTSTGDAVAQLEVKAATLFDEVWDICHSDNDADLVFEDARARFAFKHSCYSVWDLEGQTAKERPFTRKEFVKLYVHASPADFAGMVPVEEHYLRRPNPTGFNYVLRTKHLPALVGDREKCGRVIEALRQTDPELPYMTPEENAHALTLKRKALPKPSEAEIRLNRSPEFFELVNAFMQGNITEAEFAQKGEELARRLEATA